MCQSPGWFAPLGFAPTAAASCPGLAKRYAVAVRLPRWSGAPHPARGRAAQANR
ncbi:MAG: hypothetical protein V7K57_19815 [Nostoc sp.]|uniref:hypothetical protein n=1 Tax=Nostoc sp. TaxID=1180 RepID=UPI002FF90EDA